LAGLKTLDSSGVFFGLGVVCWALWKIRNKMAIEKVLIKSPQEAVFNIILLMQQWRRLLPVKDQELVRSVSRKLKTKLASLKCIPGAGSETVMPTVGASGCVRVGVSRLRAA
jgi:hypothetical protein